MISPFGIDHGNISKGITPAVSSGPLTSMKSFRTLTDQGFKAGMGPHPNRHGIKRRVGQIRQGDTRIDDKTKVVGYRDPRGKVSGGIVLPRSIG